MAKILVTGGAGFIGSHVVDAYIEAGHDVAVVDNLETGSRSYVNPDARFYEIDILDPSLEAVIAEERPTVVNHHAAQASISRSVADPVHDARTNILGAVYGDQKWYPASENHPLSPLNAYGIAKLTVENYLRYYWEVHQIRYIALRYSNVYGPRQNPHGEAGVVAIFIGMLLQGRRPIVYGDGHQTRDFIHVRDAVAVRSNILALDLLLQRGDASLAEASAINIGTGRETSVLEILHQLVLIMGGSGECNFEPAKEGEIWRSLLDIDRACKVLNWKPSLSLEEGLRETATWFMNENIQLKK